jgi:hypothetical protein
MLRRQITLRFHGLDADRTEADGEGWVLRMDIPILWYARAESMPGGRISWRVGQ